MPAAGGARRSPSLPPPLVFATYPRPRPRPPRLVRPALVLRPLAVSLSCACPRPRLVRPLPQILRWLPQDDDDAAAAVETDEELIAAYHAELSLHGGAKVAGYSLDQLRGDLAASHVAQWASGIVDACSPARIVSADMQKCSLLRVHARVTRVCCCSSLPSRAEVGPLSLSLSLFFFFCDHISPPPTGRAGGARAVDGREGYRAAG